MDERLKLLEALIPFVNDYYAKHTNADMHAFLDYASQHVSRSETDEGATSNAESAIPLMNTYANAGASLAFHVSRLGKYAKYYVKEAFKDSELINADDFAFLASVVEKGELSKSDLIAYNVHEVPSGMEVIRRLLRKGLIQERTDPDDRRIKRISCTERGKGVFFDATARMQPISRIIAGRLKEHELHDLIDTLRKLDEFHEHIYQTEKEYDIDAILTNHLEVKE